MTIAVNFQKMADIIFDSGNIGRVQDNIDFRPPVVQRIPVVSESRYAILDNLRQIRMLKIALADGQNPDPLVSQGAKLLVKTAPYTSQTNDHHADRFHDGFSKNQLITSDYRR